MISVGSHKAIFSISSPPDISSRTWIDIAETLGESYKIILLISESFLTSLLS